MFKIKSLTKHAFLVLIAFCLPLLSIAAPSIEHWESDNGLNVYYVAAPQLPMVDLRLVFDAGSSRDNKQLGLANLTSIMLAKGASGMTADTIAEQFESVGAQFGSSTGMDRSSMALRSLTSPQILDKAFHTWLAILKQPDFPAAGFKRSIKQVLIHLKAQQQSPSSIAMKALYKRLYPNHPYGEPSLGTEVTVKTITVQDLKRFYQRYYVANNAVLAIVGNISRKKAEHMAKRIANTLNKGKKAMPLPVVDHVRAIQAKGHRSFHPFSSSQSHIYMGQIGVKRGDKDYFSLYLGNYILGGGGFTSRLTKKIRVEKGLSYSVASFFIPQREAGPFVLALQTKNNQVKKAFNLVNEELRRFIDKGVTTHELNEAKLNIIGQFPLKTASNSDIVSYIAMIGFYGLPLDYLSQFPKQIEAITKEQIQSAFQRRFSRDAMQTVIVGNSIEK